MYYRIKQFIWAITARITQEEEAYVQKYLNAREQILFNQLKVYEKKHCIRVARGMSSEGSSVEQIRIGLLHDIGKIEDAIGPIRKSMIVILDKLTKGKIRRLTYLRMVRSYYQHAEIGYRLLEREGGYTEEFLICIREHHAKQQHQTLPELNTLQKWDACC